MLKFIKEGWGTPEYDNWYCTKGECDDIKAVAQGPACQGACLKCAIREGIVIETIRTPRPNKKLMEFAEAALDGWLSRIGGYEYLRLAENHVPAVLTGDWEAYRRNRAEICESLAYSNPRG